MSKRAASIVAISLVSFNFSAFAAIDPAEFQVLPRDQKFEAKLAELDPSCTDCKLTYKNTGTSVGFKLEIKDKSHGKFTCKGSATNVEAQVVSYRLGQFLGMSALVMPSAYYSVRGTTLQSFKGMLSRAAERNRWRAENRNNTLAAISRAPEKLEVVYTPHVKGGSPEVKGLANASANTINSNHLIARFIRADGPKPSANKLMTLDGVKAKDGSQPRESELELARQFSQIMVLDMIMGQWDRWSGGNVEAGIDEQRVFFTARDNGGASMVGKAHIEKYKRIVTRFDRAQIERVKRLVELLSNSTTAPELFTLLQVRTARNSLLERAKIVIEHVRRQEAAYGASTFF